MHKNTYKNSLLWCTLRESQNCSSKKGMISMSVFDLPTRAAAEAADAEETAKKPLAGEVPFDKSKEWQRSIDNLLDEALGDKAQYYKDFYPFMTTYIGEQHESFKNDLLKTESFQFKDYVIKFNGPGVSYSIDIAGVFKEMRSEVFRLQCGRARRDARNRIMSELESPEAGVARIQALELARSEKAKREILESRAKPAIDPLEGSSLYERAQAKTRKEFVDQALKSDDGGFPNDAYFENWITTDDAQKFSSKIRHCDYGSQLEDLFNETPNAKNNYTVNPLLKFVRPGEGNWKERLQAFIKRHATNNNTINFKDVAQELYIERYKEVQQDLKEKFHVSEDVLALMDRDITTWDSLWSKHEGLQKVYRRFAELDKELTDAENAQKNNDTPIPDKLKKFAAVHNEIKITAQYLGDYVAYSNRLVTLIDKLRLRSAEWSKDSEKNIFDLNEGSTDDIKTKKALATFFQDVADPQEFTRGFWGSNASTRSKGIEFQDLHGNTATLKGQWFIDSMSKETAYKLTYEEAEVITVDGEKQETKLDPEKAKAHLNRLLELGIAANSVFPGAQTLQDVMKSMDLTLTGSHTDDAKALFEKLKIDDLDNVTEPSLLAARTKFIQIGRVIFQKQKEENEKKDGGKTLSAEVKLKEKDVDNIIQSLEKSGQFNREELIKIKQEIIGGGIFLWPQDDGKAGVALGATIPLGKGFSLQATLGMPHGVSIGTGAGLSYRYEYSKDLTFVVSAGLGGGYAEGGFIAGTGGVGLNQKIYSGESYDVSFNLGVGGIAGTGGLGGGLSAGLSVSEDTQKVYEAKLAEREKAEHLDELIKLEPRTIYKEVSAHPARYPKLSDMLYQIRDLKGLNEASIREIFIKSFQMFREKLQKEAVTDTSGEGWQLCPKGFGLGLTLGSFGLGGYGYVEFKIGGTTMVFRVATDERDAAKAADAEATAAIRKHLNNKEAVVLDTPIKLNTGPLIWDAKTETLKQILTSETVDLKAGFNEPDTFAALRNKIAKDSHIFVDRPTRAADNLGLVRLSPQGAHGNINLYLDPGLKEDVIVVHKDGELYLSVKQGSDVFLKREDITYPFEHRGATEETIITISGNKEKTKEDLEMEATHFLDRAQGVAWIARPAGTGEEKEKELQPNIMTFDNYKTWINADTTRLAGRIKPLDTRAIEHRVNLYSELLDAVLITEPAPMRADLQSTIIAPLVEALHTDKEFKTNYLRNSTERYDEKPRKALPLASTWAVNYPELVKTVNEQVAKIEPKRADLNGLEIDAVLSALAIASFIDITKNAKGKERDAKEQTAALLKNLIGTKEKPGFQTLMLKAVFEGYYKDPATNKVDTAKVDAAVNIMIQKLTIKDISDARTHRTWITSETFFASFVGTIAEIEGKQVPITGIRSVVDFGGDLTYGILNKQILNLKDTGTEGEVAKFWFNKLSPHTMGLDKLTIPDKTTKEADFKEFQQKMYRELHNPLVMKLIPYLGRTMINEEMQKLSAIYKRGNDLTSGSDYITADNFEVVKKVFTLCDMVRQAEIEGKTKVSLPGGQVTVVIDKLEVATGLYEKCTNISGFVKEEFSIILKAQESKGVIAAGMSEQVIRVNSAHSAEEIRLLLGTTIPILGFKTIGKAPEAPKPTTTEKPEPTEIPERTPTAKEVPLPTPTGVETPPGTPPPRKPHEVAPPQE